MPGLGLPATTLWQTIDKIWLLAGDEAVTLITPNADFTGGLWSHHSLAGPAGLLARGHIRLSDAKIVAGHEVRQIRANSVRPQVSQACTVDTLNAPLNSIVCNIRQHVPQGINAG